MLPVPHPLLPAPLTSCVLSFPSCVYRFIIFLRLVFIVGFVQIPVFVCFCVCLDEFYNSLSLFLLFVFVFDLFCVSFFSASKFVFVCLEFFLLCFLFFLLSFLTSFIQICGVRSCSLLSLLSCLFLVFHLFVIAIFHFCLSSFPSSTFIFPLPLLSCSLSSFSPWNSHLGISPTSLSPFLFYIPFSSSSCCSFSFYKAHLFSLS